MKKRSHILVKIIAVLLMLTMLVPLFAVFVSAEEEDISSEEEFNPEHFELLEEGYRRQLNHLLDYAVWGLDDNYFLYEGIADDIDTLIKLSGAMEFGYNGLDLLSMDPMEIIDDIANEASGGNFMDAAQQEILMTVLCNSVDVLEIDAIDSAFEALSNIKDALEISEDIELIDELKGNFTSAFGLALDGINFATFELDQIAKIAAASKADKTAIEVLNRIIDTTTSSRLKKNANIVRGYFEQQSNNLLSGWKGLKVGIGSITSIVKSSKTATDTNLATLTAKASSLALEMLEDNMGIRGIREYLYEYRASEDILRVLDEMFVEEFDALRAWDYCDYYEFETELGKLEYIFSCLTSLRAELEDKYIEKIVNAPACIAIVKEIEGGVNKITGAISRIYGLKIEKLDTYTALSNLHNQTLDNQRQLENLIKGGIAAAKSMAGFVSDYFKLSPNYVKKSTIVAKDNNTITTNSAMNDLTAAYQSMSKNRGRSYQGACGTYVWEMMKFFGIVSDSDHGAPYGLNGNYNYEYFSYYNTTGTGYNAEVIAGAKSGLSNTLSSLASQGTLMNLLVCFQRGSGSSGGQAYGHVIFIRAIMGGKVYYSECFSNSQWTEGTAREETIESFCNRYKNSGTTYEFEGVVHLYKEGEEITANLTLSPFDYCSTAPAFNVYMYDHGDHVKWIQQAMNIVCGTSLDVDGSFGPASSGAMSNLRASLGLESGSHYDYDVYQYLIKELTKKGYGQPSGTLATPWKINNVTAEYRRGKILLRWDESMGATEYDVFEVNDMNKRGQRYLNSSFAPDCYLNMGEETGVHYYFIRALNRPDRSNPNYFTSSDSPVIRVDADALRAEVGNSQDDLAISLSLSDSNVELHLGETKKLTTTLRKSNGDETAEPLIWTSSDNSVLTVKNGKVKTVRKGTATVTCRTEDGILVATCTFTVLSNLTEDNPWYYIDTPTYTLLRGMSGEGIQWLQRGLNIVMDAGLEIDGSFGPLTDAAVRAFQSQYGLEVDGMAGAITRAALSRALNEKGYYSEDYVLVKPEDFRMEDAVVSKNTVDFSWTPSVGASEYEICRIDPENYGALSVDVIAVVGSEVTDYTITTPEAGTYYYAVVAINRNPARDIQYERRQSNLISITIDGSETAVGVAQHNWVLSDIIQEADYGVPGKVEYYCHGCEETEIRTIPALETYELTGEFTIYGDTRMGRNLHADVMGVNGKDSVTYQWKRNGEPIEGATDAYYMVKKDDIGQEITCTITGVLPYVSSLDSSNAIIGEKFDVLLTFSCGQEYTIKIGNGEAEHYISDTSLLVEAGQDVTISVCDEESFGYWRDSQNRIINNGSKSYTFTVTEADVYNAVYNYNMPSKATVVFKSEYGQIMMRTQINAEQAATLKFPMVPTMVGYDALGWEYTNETLAAKVAEVLSTASSADDTIYIKGSYQVKEQTYQLTVENGTLPSGEVSGEFNNRSTVSVTANEPEEGMKFAYWVKTGTEEIVSYNNVYTCYITNDVALTAVFVDENETVQLKGVADVLEITYDKENGKFSFVAAGNVPSGLTRIKVGLVYTVNAEVAESDTFEIGTSGVGKAEDYVDVYNFTVRTSKVVYVRAFIQYLDADETLYTAYSNVYSNEALLEQ